MNLLRDGTWLTTQSILLYARALLLFEIAMFGFFAAGAHGLIVPLANPISTDFVSFYAAGSLADAGTPWLAYDRAAHHFAEQQATAPGIGYNYFYYPPVFLLICAALARLPYLVAYLTFQLATLIPVFLLVRQIAHRVPTILLLAFPPVFWTLGTGQNAFLTASLFAGGTLLIERRPILAGLLLGALCYKPHFGLLIPVALVAGGHWRSFIAAALSVGALVGASLALFGVETWQAFLTASMGSQAVYTTRAIDLAGLASPFGALLVLGASPTLAYIGQGCATLALLGVVWTVWRQTTDLPLRAAILLTATPLAVPVVMFYDLLLVGVGLAWLSRPPGPAPWRKTGIAVLFVLSLLAGNLDGDSKLLIAPLVATGGFALAIAAWRSTVVAKVPATAAVPA